MASLTKLVRVLVNKAPSYRPLSTISFGSLTRAKLACSSPSLPLPLARPLILRAGLATAGRPRGSTTTKPKSAATRAKKAKARPKRKAAKKPPPPPKRTSLTYPPGSTSAYALFCAERANSVKGSLDGLEAAQALMKESSAEWKTLSSSDKQRFVDEASRINSERQTARAQWKSSLSAEEVSRERKVQSYRRSKGLRVPPASKLATRRATSPGAKTSPYVKFYTALLNDPALAQDVAGSGFGGAKVSEKAKMAGQAWRSMSEGDKANYA